MVAEQPAFSNRCHESIPFFPPTVDVISADGALRLKQVMVEPLRVPPYVCA